MGSIKDETIDIIAVISKKINDHFTSLARFE
jgi:hypothetical protein